MQAGPVILAATALAAFLGHLYPVFFGFQGGKGVATALGVSFGLHWPAGLAITAIWLLMAFLFRYSSLAALVAVAAAPAFMGAIADGATTGLTALIAVLVWARHASNIRRLLSGTEPKIGRKPDASPPAEADGTVYEVLLT